MFKNQQIGSFIVRLVLGITFFIHGLMKFQMGIVHTVGFFEKMGLPGFLAYAVGGVEIVGGVCLLLGLGTRIFSAIFVVDMLGAIFTAKWGKGFAGGYEFELALLAMSLQLFLSGNSFLSLDKQFTRQVGVSKELES
ncbi:DoxX family protein [Aneurinibacillus sp. Ricciae_BoGa-3]|uniref:DoxX family protein n=1 Tax=Aneurinibacillus sp. Ricciae_BoGa-3 TaxID=3022697 RepID=UPI00234169D0|nr:DoxX family protein [Aneurinibacillus sp. Ricciae_BoGa-3]WCK53264.1 DoxX family protein [Aneurinibacillus sp. Ricciae_BoGa-3]